MFNELAELINNDFIRIGLIVTDALNFDRLSLFPGVSSQRWVSDFGGDLFQIILKYTEQYPFSMPNYNAMIYVKHFDLIWGRFMSIDLFDYIERVPQDWEEGSGMFLRAFELALKEE